MEVQVQLYGFFLKVLSVFLSLLLSIKSVFAPHKPLPPIKSEYIKCSATTLARKIRKGEVTCERIVRAFIVRCREVNPTLNAISENRFTYAIDEAHTIDQLIDSKTKTEEELERDTPLLGVPFTVKESCSLKGLRYSVGCKLRDGIKATTNGAAVEAMIKAGAIPILVSNVPEFCVSVETYNKIIGRTKNPYDTNRTSGGSSGGEAALIASGASVIGIGSDMGGSIRVPASFNGIFGHKPTPGIVGLDGHYPLESSDNFKRVLCIGPMTRYAEDLRPMLKVMAGENAPDLRLDEKVSVENLNIYYLDSIGHPLGNFQPSREVKKKIYQVVDYFTKRKCRCEKPNIPELENLTEMVVAVFTSYILESIEQSLKDLSIDYSFLNEACKTMVGNPTFTISTMYFSAFQVTKGFMSAKRRAAYYEKTERLREMIINLLGDNGVLILYSSAEPAFHHGLFMFKLNLTMPAFLFNILRLPACSVPLGLNSQGLPIGIQVVAAPGQDRLCLAVAEELEMAFGGWVPPPSI